MPFKPDIHTFCMSFKTGLPVLYEVDSTFRCLQLLNVKWILSATCVTLQGHRRCKTYSKSVVYSFECLLSIYMYILVND